MILLEEVIALLFSWFLGYGLVLAFSLALSGFFLTRLAVSLSPTLEIELVHFFLELFELFLVSDLVLVSHLLEDLLGGRVDALPLPANFLHDLEHWHVRVVGSDLLACLSHKDHVG